MEVQFGAQATETMGLRSSIEFCCVLHYFVVVLLCSAYFFSRFAALCIDLVSFCSVLHAALCIDLVSFCSVLPRFNAVLLRSALIWGAHSLENEGVMGRLRSASIWVRFAAFCFVLDPFC